MALTNAYVLPTNRIPDLFRKIQDGQAPDRFSIQLLKDWGFTSTNDRAFIPLLKALGFLTADGMPTQRYQDYRDHSRSKHVLGQAIREAYGDIFLIKEQPTASDRNAIEGKFKSYHNASDNVATLMTKTFFGLLPLADLSKTASDKAKADVAVQLNLDDRTNGGDTDANLRKHHGGIDRSFHYNIQIHLPATKDVEVYNSIFKSLKEHLLD
ncbi:DUF5343 domain-containing protein [Bradyrhizobium lablabi]|uniref:DUF5343 domain-containing protein n=1 Tax=Bradyrhizobium lablabi TaxID=722472 RepID=UPI001BAA253E|nr:DUF5343 domain-containing protein [Bradyrhizobium lablabi]MBR1122512.1 DUF5343 domain-containing protein [Bradyrhizobium lablabi]